MKIAVVSYYFEPDITPRSFRTTELVNELISQGHEVTVFLPERELPFNISNNLKFEIVNDGYEYRSKFIFRILKFLRRIFHLKWCNFVYYVSEKLSLENYDKIISIALPIYTHAAVAIYIRNYDFNGVTIADYGDPYSYARNIRFRIIKQRLEKWILKQFDYIMIPTKNAIPIFTNFKPENKIIVIPQAININNLKINKNINNKNDIVTFSYAGNFYPKIRDPYEILTYITSLKNYKFNIYTDVSFSESYNLIEGFIKKSNGNIVVHNMLNRKDCILELSKSDFLINISNINNEQIPSKLIDYKLSGRPVFDYVPGNFDQYKFYNFLNKKYDDDAVKDFDLSSFDISKAVHHILKLN